MHQLEILQVYPEDAGVYQIIAKNQHGVVSCSARLNFGSEFAFDLEIDVLDNCSLEPADTLHANFRILSFAHSATL